MKLPWGLTHYEKLVKKATKRAADFNAFWLTARREDYERFKQEFTNGVVSGLANSSEGEVDFIVARTKKELEIYLFKKVYKP